MMDVCFKASWQQSLGVLLLYQTPCGIIQKIIQSKLDLKIEGIWIQQGERNICEG